MPDPPQSGRPGFAVSAGNQAGSRWAATRGAVLQSSDRQREQERQRSVQLRYASLGFEFTAGVAGIVLLGYWADRVFGSSPIGILVGGVLGMVGGMYHLIRRGKDLQREMSKASDERSGQSGDGGSPSP